MRKANHRKDRKLRLCRLSDDLSLLGVDLLASPRPAEIGAIMQELSKAFFDDDKFVSYSRSSRHYHGRAQKYEGIQYTLTAITQAVDWLHKQGIIDHEKAPARRAGHRQSRMRLSDEYASKAFANGIITRGRPAARRNTLIMRAEKGLNRRTREVEYNFPAHMIAEMGWLREYLSQIDLGFDGTPGSVVVLPPHKDKESRRFYDVADLFPQRIFNDGDIHLGGRIYGLCYLGLKKRGERQRLRINNERVAVVDFSSLHPRLAYA